MILARFYYILCLFKQNIPIYSAMTLRSRCVGDLCKGYYLCKNRLTYDHYCAIIYMLWEEMRLKPILKPLITEGPVGRIFCV
jgi:hypothetical protein